MTAAEILAELGIQARSTAPGRFYARCPKCSDHRKPHNRMKRCLGVTIDDGGVRWGCNNCDWTGGKFYDEKPRSFNTKVRPSGAAPQRSFRALYG